MVSQFMLILLLSFSAGASGERPRRHLIIQEDIEAKQVRQQASTTQGPGKWKPFQKLKTWWRKGKAAGSGKAPERDKTPAAEKEDSTSAETEEDKTPEEIRREPEIRQELMQAFPEGSPFHEMLKFITSGQEDLYRLFVEARFQKKMASFISQHPAQGVKVFKLLAADKDEHVRQATASSRLWPELLKNGTEAWQIFEELVTDSSWVVKKAAAASPALQELFWINSSEAWRIFRKSVTALLGVGAHGPGSPFYELVKNIASHSPVVVARALASDDMKRFIQEHPAKGFEAFRVIATEKESDVRDHVVSSPLWPELFRINAAEAFQLFKKLAIDDNFRMQGPAWPEAFKYNGTGALQILKIAVTSKRLAAGRSAGSSYGWPAAFNHNPTEVWPLFKKLVADPSANVRGAVAKGPAWEGAFQLNATEALRIFKTLAADRKAYVNRCAADSRAWEAAFQENVAETFRIFKTLVMKESWLVRVAAAASPAWLEVFKYLPMEALQLFKQLTADEYHEVRAAAADSENAWHGLNDTALPRSADPVQAAGELQAIANVGNMKKVEGTKMLKEIVGKVVKSHDEEFLGKMANFPITLAAKRLVEIANEQRKAANDAKMKTEKALKVAKEERAAADKARQEAEQAKQKAEARRKDAEAQRREAQLARAESEVRQKEAVEAQRDAELQRQKAEDAREKVEKAWEEAEAQRQRAENAQKAANYERQVALQQSEAAEKARKRSEVHKEEAREEAERARLALKAAEEAAKIEAKAQKRASAEAKKANEERETARLLLGVALLSGALAVIFFLLWFYWPAISQWREEREVIRQAKVALKEAEKCTAPSSADPASPVDLDVLQKYREIYEKVDVLYKYECLKPALKETFRICTKALEDGLTKWDFSEVEKQSQESESDPMAKLAKANYDWARGFINQKPGEIEHWEPLMKLCEELKSLAEEYPEKIEKKYKDPVERCMEMYRQAFMAKSAYFKPTIEKIAAATGARAKIGDVKGIFRLAEKNALRPEQGLIWDSVRAMLVGRTFSQLEQVLQLLKEEHDAKHIKILEVNNRFAKPTQGGWQDIAVYIMFTDTDFDGLVAEIQLTHQALQAVRENFGAHDAYVANRFAAEALKKKKQVEVAGLPDSQRLSAPNATAVINTTTAEVTADGG